MSHADPTTQIDVNLALKEPPMFRVIYLNDDKTTMDFVVETLMNFFNYSIDAAIQATTDIHEKGSAVVAILPYEIAEQKGIEVTMHARNNNFPLQVKLEPDA
jgi:ATP-dependent Clp protease adaptor protein ClpS